MLELGSSPNFKGSRGLSRASFLLRDLRAAKAIYGQPDIASSHSIILSAVASSVGGTLTTSAFVAS
jgi:hypothetical protein